MPVLELSVNDWKETVAHLITVRIWMPWIYRVWERRTKLFWNLHPKPETVLWIKSRTGEDVGHFSTGPINKAVPSFRNSLTEYVKGDGVVKVVMWSRGGGLTWRSQVGANPIPIPHPTNLALFGHKITLSIQSEGSHCCRGLKSEQGAESPGPLTLTTA